MPFVKKDLQSDTQYAIKFFRKYVKATMGALLQGCRKLGKLADRNVSYPELWNSFSIAFII